MQVLFFTDTYYPFISGVAQVIDSLTKALERRGIETTIVSPSQQFHIQSYSSKGSEGRKIQYIPSMSLLKLYESFRFPIKVPIVPELVENKNTVISTHSPFFSTAGAILTAIRTKKAKKMEIPIVSTFHTNINLFSQDILPIDLPDEILSFTRHMMEKLLNRTLFTTVPSVYIGNSLKAKGTQRLVTIRYPLAYDRFEKPKDSLQSLYPQLTPHEYLFKLGRVSKEKRIEYLIRTFVDTDVPLVIAGTGPLLPKMREKYGEEENIHLFGFIPDSHVNLLNKYAAATLSAGYAEVQPLTPLEGMAQGTPAIAYHIGGQNTYLKDHENGFIFKNREELREKAGWLLEDSDLRRKLGKKAKNTALKYHPDKVVREWIILFKTALSLSKKHSLY